VRVPGRDRALLAEIAAAASGPTPASDLAATVARLEASNAELRQVIHQLKIDKRNLATENLSLLHRARIAEDRVIARDRDLARLKGPKDEKRAGHRSSLGVTHSAESIFRASGPL
jgi:hypothetical protein